MEMQLSKYILLEDDKVKEIIPEYNPKFPNIPITKRYTKEFVDKLIKIDSNTKVEQNWLYDADFKVFINPNLNENNEGEEL